MRRFLLIIAGLVVAVPAVAADISSFNTLYGKLLAEYWRPPVPIHGIETTVFDYGAMQREAGPLMEKIAATLEHTDPAALGNDNESKAFWINVYNFTAMRLVVDAYPVDSITSFKISLLKHPWSKKSIRVGGRWYSLSEIEKDILLARFNDPRIVFVVSCAAVSCPDRTAGIFSGAEIDAQLDELIQNFFLNPEKGFLLNREAKTVTLSWILKKDGHLFQDAGGGIMEFVSPYLNETARDWLAEHEVTLEYFDHDWTLNDLAQADADQ